MSVGSPPRMRGKGIKRGRFLAPIRITPAYAGKSLRRAPQRPLYRDHPRVCGEKFLTAKALCLPPGSPPRMRGKGNSYANRGRHYGITPAYAGKRVAKALDKIVSGDHPRVCGEKLIFLRRIGGRLGSPPRMRGKAVSPVMIACRTGITPAYAGKRLNLQPTDYKSKDHPRVCGEK